MITVIKRDGRKVPFDRNKIVNAVLKAFLATYGDISEYAKKKAENIAQYVENEIPQSELSVEQIQDYVEHGLMALKDKSVAKNYILYRERRSEVREANSDIMKVISNKLFASDVVNQNANVDERSFGGRKGEAANELLKQYALNYCMSEKSKRNHLENRIYIHDLDSYAIGMHNCFSGDTKFVTDSGVRMFAECGDGAKVKVLDMNGDWKTATVKYYGEQHLQTVTFESQGIKRSVRCTPNHRWILSDGTVTTELKVGDKLALLKQHDVGETDDVKAFCYGYALANGFDYHIDADSGTAIVLGSKEHRYIEMFKEAGFTVSKESPDEDYVVLESRNQAVKQTVLSEYKSYDTHTLEGIFEGLYAASSDSAGVFHTHREVLAQMIRDISAICGYHVIEETQEKTAEDVTKFSFRFIKEQHDGENWTVIDIDDSEEGLYPVWCVEEPTTRSFTLYGGIVTGNCLTIPFDDLLAKGFVTRQVDIRPANSVGTAFQLVAVIFQLQSLMQFGLN